MQGKVKTNLISENIKEEQSNVASLLMEIAGNEEFFKCKIIISDFIEQVFTEKEIQNFSLKVNKLKDGIHNLVCIKGEGFSVEINLAEYSGEVLCEEEYLGFVLKVVKEERVCKKIILQFRASE
ncbi:MAG: hypothetical protein ACOCQR_00915 [bacterium]